MSDILPRGFEALQPFVGEWVAGSSAARDALRCSMPAGKRKAFYEAFKPLIGPALERLDGSKLDQFDEAENNLMRLALAYAHAAQAEEVQASDESKHALARRRLPITRAPADL